MADTPPLGTSARRTFVVRNHAGCNLNLRLAYHTLTRSGSWQWFNQDFNVSWTIAPGKKTTLSHDDFKINADYVRFYAGCQDSDAVWNHYKETPLYIGNKEGGSSGVEGEYIYTFWTTGSLDKYSDQHTRRYLQVVNATSEPLTVYVGYHTKTDSGKWAWFDYDLTGGSWTIQPGEESFLEDSDGFVINGDAVHIKAISPSGKKWGPEDVFIGEFEGDGSCLPKSSPYTYRFVSSDETTHYNPATVESYKNLAKTTNGRSFYAPNASALPGVIFQAIDAGVGDLQSGESADIALIVDTTSSMMDDIAAVKEELNKLIDRLKRYQSKAGRLRVGLVLYRDFGDEYLNKTYQFRSDLEEVRSMINAIEVAGGGDEPEAVYDALYAALTKLDWSAQHRAGILIGDAPPHPKSPEGHSYESISELARRRGVEVNLYPIIVGL